MNATDNKCKPASIDTVLLNRERPSEARALINEVAHLNRTALQLGKGRTIRIQWVFARPADMTYAEALEEDQGGGRAVRYHVVIDYTPEADKGNVTAAGYGTYLTFRELNQFVAGYSAAMEMI
jgi:hypothetical protein